ncbi:hypothetical protein [Chryseobacterium arthrosphaerae]|uniref:hypothetical protein n=1 Tax=Chryseobacterium arthrosphaerae TaxID=651561 RepID=UPI001E4ABB9B|nr:hypothetical protein [Chryseobacterium arthrosphaerae]UEQ78333.1 hypothetical protein J8N07_08565 [Chryseobacterium arthrosphaerae]
MATLIAPEYFNNHIAVEGEIIVKSVPNDAGSVLVWNPITKKISQRTKAEIIGDLDLMTLSTHQFVNGQKYFISSGIADEFANKLWVRSEDGSEPGITFWKTGHVSSTLTLRDDGFHFGVASKNHYDAVKAERFIKNGSSDNYFLRGDGTDYDSRKKEDSWFHSTRDFPSGTLIQTDINYSQSAGDQFLLEMKGNMYGGGLPLDAKIQGYIYNDTIIQSGGYSTLHYFHYMIALNNNGQLCFWIPPMSYWQGFDVKVTAGYGGLDQGKNRVLSITDSVDPGGIKRVQINLKHLLTKEELISDSPFWEKKNVGGYWALDSDKPIAGLNGAGAQVILSGGLLASDAYTDKQFIPANGVHAKGFVQSDEGFFNRYWKANVRNPIWSFGNAQTYGLSYYQGSAHVFNEGIGFHFGDTDNPLHFLDRSGLFYSKQGISSASFTTENKQVLNYANPSTLYIGNPSINNIIESNNNSIAHYKNGVSGVVWDSHNLDPSAFIKTSDLNSYVPYNGAVQDVNLGTKDLEFDGGGSISKRQNSVRIFNKVYQGYYDVGGHTGILAIKMPQASPNETMFSIDINIYGYESQYLGKVNVAFYKYVSGSIIPNGSKAIWEVTDNFPTTTARVGIGSDGYVSILLGESDTFWNGYFSFEIAKVETKYGNYNLDWNAGWSHAIESNFDLYNGNLILLPSDVVATRSWLASFADKSYIPKAVQYNNNFNSLGGYSTSGIYRANNDEGGVQHLYSPMLHMGTQDTTAQLQVKYNDNSASAGELVYRSGYNGNWSLWRKAWDNVNFKPTDYQTRNTDEIISAAKSYYNRIPFKFKNSSYKSWAIQKLTNNNLLFAPSVSKNAEDWDLNNSIELTDTGLVSSRGFNKIGYDDNYILTAGGGHRLASDFISSSSLSNYVTLNTPQSISAKKYFTQGLTVNTNYGGLPVLGQMNNIPSKVSATDETYGMGMGIVDSGQGFIQQQRFDGTAHAYDLLLQPSGGNVVVGYNQMDYHNDKLETIGKIVSKGNEMNSVKTYVSVHGVDEIVAGHTFNWYNTSWKVGNMRGGSANSTGYRFEFSNDGGASYEEKVKIHTDGNITTQNYGQAQQWNQAYQWGNHANSGYVKEWENAQAIGFSNGLSAGAPYMYHRTDGYVFLATQSWASGRFVNVDGQQNITGLKIIKGRARNTGTGWGNTSTSTDYSFLIETESGSNTDNQYTGSIGFFSNSGAQAGIYVRSNDSNGTSMAFATTSLFSAGPQISMTINNYGTVDFTRANPTVEGKMVFHAGKSIDYDYELSNIMSLGYDYWNQRKLLSRGWNSNYGDYVEINVPGANANAASFKLTSNNTAYVGNDLIITESVINNKYHKVDYAASISNGSTGRHNTSWFDYNWADSGRPGSVINFTGLNSDYSTELFMQYNGNGMDVGVRSRNGDTTDKAWNPARWVWHDGHFTKNDINMWNSMASSGIRVNQPFTNITGNGLMVVDNYNGGESGIYNEKDKFYLAVFQDKYYKYSSTYKGWEGINFNKGNKNIGIGAPAQDAYKVNVAGSMNVAGLVNVTDSVNVGNSANVSGSVNVLGTVQSVGNFKSANQEPNTLFIPDGSLAYLDDEITNEGNRMRLSHAMIDQDPGIQYYGSESRMLVIRCTDPMNPFILKECFTGQRILVMNTHREEWQIFRIDRIDYDYRIPPYTSIQLFVWDEKTVYKYAQNRMD